MTEHVVKVIGEVTIDGCAVTRSQRPLVAALVLGGSTGISVDALVNAVWPDRVPPSARQSVQNQIARLRRSFGADLILTSADRYRLVAVSDIDMIDRMAMIDARSSITCPDAWLIGDLLSSWTGEPYADLPDHPLAQAERARLHHVQSRLVEALALHHLTDPAGDLDAAIVDLTVRTSTDPLHEQAWELLVVALHLVGRRTEALGTYARFTELLDEQLGAAPSRHFQQLRELVDADRPVDPATVLAATGTPMTPRLRSTA